MAAPAVAVSKMSWLVPGFTSSLLICMHEIVIRYCKNRFGITPENFTLTWLMAGGAFSALIALRKRTSTSNPYTLSGTPLWVFALVGWTLTQQEQLIKIATGSSPNPGTAKVIVNLNTAWIALAGLAFFKNSQLSATNWAGLALSLMGGALTAL